MEPTAPGGTRVGKRWLVAGAGFAAGLFGATLLIATLAGATAADECPFGWAIVAQGTKVGNGIESDAASLIEIVLEEERARILEDGGTPYMDHVIDLVSPAEDLDLVVVSRGGIVGAIFEVRSLDEGRVTVESERYCLNEDGKTLVDSTFHQLAMGDGDIESSDDSP
jgi:hypothetical protein